MAPEIENRRSAAPGGKPGVPASGGTPDLPTRGYFLLKEVCKITDTQPYVLRFWESEFPQLAGKKRGRQVTYTQEDIGLILQIKQLLHNEEYTLADAREQLEHGEDPPEPVEEPVSPDAEALQEEVETLRERLADIRGRYEGAIREIAHLKGELAAADDSKERFKESVAGRLQAIQQAFRNLTGFRSS